MRRHLARSQEETIQAMPAISPGEQGLMAAIRALGGVARAAEIGEFTGTSEDYAEQLCNDLVGKKYLVTLGGKFKLATDWDGLEEEAKVLTDQARGRFTLGVYEAKSEVPGAVQSRAVHPGSVARVRTLRDPGQPADRGTPGEQAEQEGEKKSREVLEKFTPMTLDY